MELDQLITRHHVALFRYAYRLTGSQSDAEDLTQQTFLTAVRKIDQVRDPTKVQAWLFTILRSFFLKTMRKRRPIAASDLDFDVNQIDEPIAASDQIDKERIQWALTQLADDYRIVVLMFYFEQLSYKEIAKQLGIPLGTVMSRLSRAKAYLRTHLNCNSFRERTAELRNGPDKTTTNIN